MWIVVCLRWQFYRQKDREMLANQPWKGRRFQCFQSWQAAILISAAILRQISRLFPYEARFPLCFLSVGFFCKMAPQHYRHRSGRLLVIAAIGAASLPLIFPPLHG
jgi:hypothetical protein